MAYSDATRIDNNTQQLTDEGSVKTDVRNAVKTFGESIETVLSTYGLNSQGQQAFRDSLVDLCRDVGHAMSGDYQ